MPSNIANLSDNIVATDYSLSIKENTAEAKNYDELQAERLQILKDIHASKNLADILAAEKLLLATEAVKFKEQDSSIKTALKQFDAGKKALSLVDNKEAYKQAVSIYPEDTKDSFRKFIDSHQTRLTNRLKSPEISEIQGNLLQQRYANLTLANELYKEKQREALRPDTPEETAQKEKADDMRNLSI